MENSQDYQEIVMHYIHAYNNFNIRGMLKDLHQDILFENVSEGRVNLKTQGIAAFEKQAESAKSIFQKREQQVTNIQANGNTVKVQIDYTGILAVDLPNGLKAGDTINMVGKSTFIFREGKIFQITDES